MSDLDDPSEDEIDTLLDAALAEPNQESQKKLIQQITSTRAIKRATRSPKVSRSGHSQPHRDAQKDAASISGSKSRLKESQDHLPSIREGIAQRGGRGEGQGQSSSKGQDKGLGLSEMTVLPGRDAEIVVSPVSVSGAIPVPGNSEMAPKSPRRSVSMGADSGIDEMLRRPGDKSHADRSTVQLYPDPSV